MWERRTPGSEYRVFGEKIRGDQTALVLHDLRVLVDLLLEDEARSFASGAVYRFATPATELSPYLALQGSLPLDLFGDDCACPSLVGSSGSSLWWCVDACWFFWASIFHLRDLQVMAEQSSAINPPPRERRSEMAGVSPVW